MKGMPNELHTILIIYFQGRVLLESPEYRQGSWFLHKTANRIRLHCEERFGACFTYIHLPHVHPFAPQEHPWLPVTKLCTRKVVGSHQVGCPSGCLLYCFLIATSYHHLHVHPCTAVPLHCAHKDVLTLRKVSHIYMTTRGDILPFLLKLHE